MTTNTELPAARPFSKRDRNIIITIINRSDYPYEVKPEDFEGLMIINGVVEIKLSNGYTRFNQDQFKSLVTQVKTDLPETADERNDRLHNEFQQAIEKYQVSHGQIDWLCFSSKIYSGNHCIGTVGYGMLGWYSRQRDRGSNTFQKSADDAIKALIRVRVAA